MEKVIVIGCPGSGKSTFSQKLQEKTGLPLYHLDMLFWNPDRTTVSREIFMRRLLPVLDEPRWIIDGNYQSTMELRLQKCDTVIFLDYSTELCIQGIRERQGKPRKDLPWVEPEESEEFLAFIRKFSQDNRPEIMDLLQKFSHKNIMFFHNRDEASLFLSQILW